MKRLIGVAIGSLMLLGCDISGRLVIANKTDQTVTLDIGEFRGGNSIFGIDMDSIIVNPSQKQTIYYGFGGFYDEETDSLMMAMKSVEFSGDGGTNRVTNKECLREALPKRVTGLMNSTLRVKIKKSLTSCHKP